MWKINGQVKFGIIGQIHPSTKDVELPEYTDILDKKLEIISENDGWKTYKISVPIKEIISREICDVEFSLALYRKRFILYIDYEIQKENSIPIDDVIRYIVGDIYGTLKSNVTCIFPPDVSIKVISFIFCENLDKTQEKNIVNAGIASFNYKIYNSETSKMGFIRISRHIIMSSGLNDFLIQELINSCYESILADKGDIKKNHVFAFLKNINRFAVPIEEARYIQNIMFEITVLFISFSILIAIVAASCLESLCKIGLYVLMLFLIYPIIKIMPIKSIPKRMKRWIQKLI